VVDLLLSGPNIPRDFRRVRFTDYDTRRGDAEVVDALQDWNPAIDEPLVLMQGKPGVGKTMLACATLNSVQTRVHTNENLMAQSKRTLRQLKYPVYFIQLAELISLHIRLFRLHDLVVKTGAEPTEYYELDKLLGDLERRVKVLVIDDVGKEHHTDTRFAEDVFDLLVRHRHNNGVSTVLTSNLPLYRWADEYTPSMKSLIQRSALILEF
jgi:DNA replication protein DnaC